MATISSRCFVEAERHRDANKTLIFLSTTGTASAT
jgi:hypothetical protein